MHLIADSGSTKTDWRIANQPNFQLLTNGLNPMVASPDFLNREINNVSNSPLIISPITKVTFYGAGCGKSESVKLMSKILGEYFPTANIEVDTDLMGAAKALFNHSNGIVAILGTGSNAAYYDGKTLYNAVPSLGYLLGDDGAGTGIGKTLLKSYLYGNNDWLDLLSQENLETDKTEIIQKMYAAERPNTFIASFAQAALNNLTHPIAKDLVKKQFTQFITDLVLPNATNSNHIGFIGSIAFYAQDLLTEVCEENNLELVKVIQQPIDELVKHLENKV